MSSSFKYIEKDGKTYLVIGENRIEVLWNERWVPAAEHIQPGPQPGTATFTATSLINCYLTGIASGDQIAVDEPLTFTVTGTENNLVGGSISNNGIEYTSEEIASLITAQGENWFEFTIPVVNGNIVVSFEFQGDEPTTYTVTYMSMDSNITFSSDQAEVEANDSLELYVVPNEGYRIKEGASMIIMMDGSGNIATTAFDPTTGRIYVEHVTGNIRITAVNVAEPIPAANATITFNLTDCHFTINGVEISSGYQVPLGQPLEIAVVGDYMVDYEWSCQTLTMNGVDISLSFDGDGNPASIEIASVTGDIYAEIECNETEEPEPEMATISISNLTGCHLEIDGEQIYNGHEVELGTSVDIDVVPDDVSIIEADYGYQTLTMDGQNIGSYFNTTDGIISIPNVTGNIVIDGIVCTEREPDEPEDEVPIESIRYTDGQGNTCIGFNMNEGATCDLWDGLEVLPIDYTEGVDFSSSDDAVISVDGGGIATAVGTMGESATITISAIEDPSIYTTVSISISEDEPDEPDEPEEE